ncbi:hypothetical protein PICMEDRAFT_35931 [Pichia membranifaciens NRRL Y-2026]|uniref:Actin-like protein ARP6 n=1 Tax=Pichia membranifaciens NRRL Y-2026 TaxID=763406 RepID=A0A1E3NG51_9ASCO|nr:hypothetical protein PICMEDRAFT_35931 [Pichia membranifaciens NRRL Y-2026]ODQ45120.1 hypothetical protein PICMEDRAFT_35931 [Pichia membranifaciens NRRL Y-2026]
MAKNVIIDNGQYALKFGNAAQDAPHTVPNCIIRTQDKRVHLGSTLSSQQSLRDLAVLSGGLSGIAFQRPIRKGQCFQWNLEHQIWDNGFIDSKVDSGNGDFLEDSNLLYVESPITLPKFQNMTDQILFEEFGIGNLVRYSAPALAPWLDSFGDNENYKDKETKYRNFQLVIDSGFDATWIVPVIYGIPYYRAIRKLPIAGRFLDGYLREVVSFRHYNIVEEPVLVNAIKHQTCYVAVDYNETLNKLTRLKKNPRELINSELSLSYVLPNNKTDFLGHPILDKSKIQSLLLTDERFLIPELLFHPQLAGVYKAGLIQTIKSSLDAVPELLQPLLVNNIACIGGTSNIPGFAERIVKDLDPEVPVEAQTKVSNYSNITNDTSLLSWYAGKSFFANGGFEKIKMTKADYAEFGAEYAQDKFSFKL